MEKYSRRNLDNMPVNVAAEAPSSVPADAPADAPIHELPVDLLRELRSDHAGELGAVWIYRGVLAVTRDPALRAFATEHLATERTHLAFFETQLPAAWHTRLAPLWRLAGWLLGAGPALLGPRAVYRTVAAVERFVDGHYAAQIARLADLPRHAGLRQRLIAFRDDELGHRDEAADRAGAGGSPGPWERIVDAGSAAGAALARRL
jgi:ubiquinone biosynthesis monooxygenase Coq7